MRDELELIRSINRRLLSDLAGKRDDALAKLQELNVQAARLSAFVEQLEHQRLQIEASEQLQTNFLTDQIHSETDFIIEHGAAEEASDASDGDEAERGKLKARIGNQRYLILITIRESGHLTLETTVAQSGLPFKRVKDAIKADLELGVLRESAYFGGHQEYIAYALTDIGIDLLDRFEAYKRQKGQRIPSKGEILKEAGVEAADNSEGRTLIPGPTAPPADPNAYGTVRTVPSDSFGRIVFGGGPSSAPPRFRE